MVESVADDTLTKVSSSPVKRLVVCIDGAGYQPNGTLGFANVSNVYRINSIVSQGLCHDANNQSIHQVVRYYQAAGETVSGPTLAEKIKSKVSVNYTEIQIKDVTREICEILEDSQDELFLYGFSRGAYVVRAVAGLLHHMRLPKRTSMVHFDELYSKALDLYKARCEENSAKGTPLLQFIRAHTDEPPRIQFMGLFDTVATTIDKSRFDVSLVPAIQNLRHAIALNETGMTTDFQFMESPSSTTMLNGTFVQAWFVGTHLDLGGGTQHDGLSLYPLQWMLLESIKTGLLVKFDGIVANRATDRNPLALTFPQFAGNPPSLGTEDVEWQFPYVNGLHVSMFDLHTLHVPGKAEEQHSHIIQLQSTSALYKSTRKVFGSKGLLGWSDSAQFGTIIHPSVFCLVDRNTRLQEQSRFKNLKTDLADFQERCMKGVEGSMPPWLQDTQLSASGVQAFRILVCGKTGVGKSTLINKVFGVEMTAESISYDQGVHDIEKAFESPSQPGLFIHDSRGWQAGSESELDLIAKFLRNRAFQRNPAEALHVIWFCVDSDVSRIEEAEKRTFETIAEFSHHVPVFVVGTKKDKLIAVRKMSLLDEYMKETGNYQDASRLASEKANDLAEAQFAELISQLSRVKHYKADGYCCLSKDDDVGIKNLLNQTLELIADDRVRLFCVAAQVVDVEQKINSAITECMRLGTHAVRTAMVPLPFSGMIGTPTVCRIIVEHVLQCFGFPQAAPDAVEQIMSRVVLKNLKRFMIVSITQFVTVGIPTAAVAAVTAGAGTAIGFVGCILAAPPTARMLLQCACDMILILERSFRYGGRYVSVKQIEDAATYYTTATIKASSGKDILLQDHVHEEINRLVPLKNLKIGWSFRKIQTGVEDIVYKNRFDKLSSTQEITHPGMAELAVDGRQILELEDTARLPELEGDKQQLELVTTGLAELEGDPVSTIVSPKSVRSSTKSDLGSTAESIRTDSSNTTLTPTGIEVKSPDSIRDGSPVERERRSSITKGWKKSSGFSFSSKFSLRKPKTPDQ